MGFKLPLVFIVSMCLFGLIVAHAGSNNFSRRKQLGILNENNITNTSQGKGNLPYSFASSVRVSPKLQSFSEVAPATKDEAEAQAPAFQERRRIIFPPDTPLVSFKNHPTFFLTLDKTGSFVGGKQATTHEVKLGLDFKKKLKLGIGYGKLVSDVVLDDTIKTHETHIDSVVMAQLELSFFSLNSEYVFFNNKQWQVAMPVSLGFGSSYFSHNQFIGNDSKPGKIDKEGVVLLTAHGLATYRILRWIGASAGIGYRLSFTKSSSVRESFNSPVYIIKIRVFMGEIYKSVFPRGIMGTRNPPYSNEYWD